MRTLRRSGDHELSDDRVLGSGEFVERIIKEAEGKIKYQFSVQEHPEKIGEFIAKVCKNKRGFIEELIGIIYYVALLFC